MKRKTRMWVIITIVFCIGICCIIFTNMQDKSFPKKYESVLSNFFGDYKIEENKKDVSDKSYKFSANQWKINYGDEFKKEMIIVEDVSPFSQLENLYFIEKIEPFMKFLNNQNISIELRNAYNGYELTNYNKDQNLYDKNKEIYKDEQILNNYEKVYSLMFNLKLNNEYKLLYKEKSAFYFMVYCKDKEDVYKLISEVPEVNTIVKLSDIPVTEERMSERVDEGLDKYIFVYNGKIIDSKEVITEKNDYIINNYIYYIIKKVKE